MTTAIPPRVVVTGLGVVSPLGSGVEPVWSRLIDGRSGIRALSEEGFAEADSKVGAPVPAAGDDPCGFDIDALISVKDQRKMDRFIHLGLEAARQAIEQANWHPETEAQRERTAVIIGTSIGGFTAAAKSVRLYDENPARRLSPFTIPSFLINLAAGHISIRHGFKGPTGSPVTACIASTQAIGDAMRLIANGEADLAVCGGAEACIDPIILQSFAAAGALSTHFNDDPAAASRPFSIDRDGFVLGEGAAVLVLESLDHALRRGAEPIAEIVGYGTCSDAYHITACLDDGDGLQRAMRMATRMAGITAQEIGYLNAHASSTPLGDKSETVAIREFFGTDSGLSISATKSATGHLLGATGGIEALFSILALRDGILPPTLNLRRPDPVTQGLDIIGPESRRKAITYAMSNNTGFGGLNASLIFKKWALT